ncbi:MAG: DUF1127 domain-containing protein [Pseudomonadota bacterium]
MANIEPTRVAPFGAISVLRLVETFEAAVKFMKAAIVANRTHNQLSSLSQAQLRDIGLADQDLAAFCWKMAERH